MKVIELIELLQKEDPDDLVVMSKDGEGNSFSPFCDINRCQYLADSTWSGETSLRKLTPELQKDGFTEEDIFNDPDAVKAISLWPIN